MERWNGRILGERCQNHHSVLPLFQYSSPYHLLEKFLLFEGHLPGFFFRPLMLVADQVQDAVDHQKNHHLHSVEAETIRLALGRLDGNHQVAEEMGVES